MIRVSEIKLRLSEDEALLAARAAAALKVPEEEIKSVSVVKRSIDARDRREVLLVFTVLVSLKSADERALAERLNSPRITFELPQPYLLPTPSALPGCRPIVAGAGPAGLFAALTLARAGLRPLLIERGAPVDERVRDVRALMERGTLLPESNALFGEGGAGTFSDGKLTTGIKDPRCAEVLRLMAAAGAPEEILYQAKPHIGTDRLVPMVKRLREQIVSLGGEVRFHTLLSRLCLSPEGKLRAVILHDEAGEREEPAETLILAIGHSARDTVKMLYDSRLAMAQKPFSAGVRIEHLQKSIDRAQYRAAAGDPRLGAADYKLAVHLQNGRGVYTFCMCPGGEVIAAATEPDGVCVNGMSLYGRNGVNANSALLVDVRPEDFGSSHPLAGVEFQRKLERAAFRLGGGDYRAPVQLAGDFLDKRTSTAFGEVKPSYRPGVQFAPLDECLPEFICASLREALPLLDRRLRGFASRDAVLTGVETRSSSPVRILRGETLESSVPGVYPCGEGAGYAGGIMSAAVDGIRCAEAVITREK